ncbi:hypothetical protein [Pelagerythrobacter sp.]|uniref:hypothetical protein n=1 Tax=Pelagerythrobacter sp. TaxID=2800702 RepID=UPI0035AE542E
MAQRPAQELQSNQEDTARQDLDVLGREILNPVSNWALFWKPRYLAASSTLVHLPYLFWLVENHAPLRVVQLGIGDGVAYLAVCQAIDKLRLDAACWGISPPGSDTEATSAALESNKRLYDDFSIVKIEKMATAHRHFRNAGIDLLIINAPLDDETANLLKSNWEGLLSDRGLVVILDSTVRMTESGATSWLDPLLAAHPGIELDQGEGLVTLLIGDDQNSRVKRLADLELGVAGYRESRQVFRSLGDGIVAQARVGDLEDTRQADSESLTGARDELDKKRQELANARSSEEDALQQLAAARAKNFDFQTEYEEVQAKLADAERSAAEIQKVKSALADTEARLSTTEQALTEAELKLTEAAEKHADLETQLSVKDHQAEAKDAEELALLKSQYQMRLADIAELGHSIARKDDELQRLKLQHDDDVMQRYILAKLGETHLHLHTVLNQPHRFRANRRAKEKVADEIRLVDSSGLFDAEWYCASYPDVEDSGIEPVRHFATQGAYELRNPGPDFDSFEYHKFYPDVTAGGVAALIHYARNGKSEGRRTFPVGEGS